MLVVDIAIYQKHGKNCANSNPTFEKHSEIRGFDKIWIVSVS